MRTHRPSEPANRMGELVGFHLRAVQEQMLQADEDFPVGFVIDGTDEFGREVFIWQLARFKGISREQAESEIDTKIAEGRAVLIFANDGYFTFWLLETLSELDSAARQHFEQLRRIRSDGKDLVVVVAAGTFGCVRVPSVAVSDGQHRTAIR